MPSLFTMQYFWILMNYLSDNQQLYLLKNECIEVVRFCFNMYEV